MIDSYHLYLTSTQAIARRKTGLPWRSQIEPIADWSWDAGNPASLLLEQLNIPKKQRAAWMPLPALHVYAGSALCKFMAVNLPAGLSDEQELRIAAQAQMQNQLGLNSSEWEFSVDVNQAPEKSIVCAIRRNVLERMRALSAANGLSLVSVKPYVAGVWNAFAEHGDTESHTALVTIEHDAFTVLMSKAGALDSASSLLHQRENDLIDREIKRLGFSFSATERIHLAVSNALLGLAQANIKQVLPRLPYLQKNLYADFRDLSFAASTGAI